MIIDVVTVFVPAIAAFGIGALMTPLLTHYLYKYRAWKKQPGKLDLIGKEASTFNRLHKDKEVNTPRMGGIVVWGSTGIVLIALWILEQAFPHSLFEKLEFVSRSQTWIPLTLFFIGALIGLADDLLEIRELPRFSQGLSLPLRLSAVTALSLAAGWWFYDKLDVVSIGIPFMEPFTIGWLIVPLFVLAALFIYASGVIDGIDGLAGGVFAAIFAAYAGIAFFQNQIDLAAFSATITGATLAFLWFNIPPARFYMSETGTMALTLALVTIAFMTDSLGDGHGLLSLGLVAFPLVATVLSVIVQLASRKFRNGKRVFRIAPLHHHFEAIGWPSYKVTMRYWVLSVVFAITGVAFALIG